MSAGSIIPFSIRIVIFFLGSLVQTSTLLRALPGFTFLLFVSTVTVIFPLPPGGISAELAEALVQALQAGIISSSLRTPLPSLITSKSYFMISPFFTFPNLCFLSGNFTVGSPGCSDPEMLPFTVPVSDPETGTVGEVTNNMVRTIIKNLIIKVPGK